MNSGATWNERGLSPELYQAAREAARRAGMSVEEWLNATFGNSTGMSAAASNSQSEPETSSLRGARLSETVAKLNARLEQLTSGREGPSGARNTTADSRRAPPLAPEQLDVDQVIAEIAARQRALEEAPMAPMSGDASWHGGYEPPSLPDLGSLERQLNHITAQIETLRQPSSVEDAVAALRADLAEIAHALNEALPRRAIEALQADVHALAGKIERGYDGGADPQALQGIERCLNELYAAIGAMRPAESLAGFDERVSELSRKMDSFSGGRPDPEMLRYLEAAINELRELSHGVASAEGVAALAGDVQALGARIDRIAETTGASGLDTLAQRVNELTHALDSRVEQIGPLPSNIESLVKSLSDKLNRPDAPSRDLASFEQLERRIVDLADKIEAADNKFGDLGAIERGIDQLTLHVREAREEAIATAERVARAVAAEMPRGDSESVRRDLETLHAHQSESEQRTQDTLEAVHDTLERLVERLANVETDLRSAPANAAESLRAAELARAAETLRAHEPMMAREPGMPAARTLEPLVAMPAQIPSAQPAAVAARPATPFVNVQRVERPPIDPDLPADTPLEPGIGVARGRSPAERIAASEAALGPALGTLKREGEVTGKANFIAAARRAAQAAANEGGLVEGPRTEEHKADETPTSLIGRFLANRRRALMVGVSALLMLYGTVQLAGMFGGADNTQEPPRMTPSQSQAPEPRKMAAPAPVAPPAVTAAEPTPPVPIQQSTAQPLVAPTPTASLISPPPVASPAAPPVPATPAVDVTGSVKPPLNIAALAAKAAETPPANGQTALPVDKLAASMGPALRAAAAAGNPDAEYEIGVRYSEGRGVAIDLELAAQWFESAAKHGLAPAQYRLGSLYEKGLGVKKDLNKARQLYLQAADKGNAKAVHNLAVLYAEGIDGKPDYQIASQWFRKAANRGVADSQYNLGILYARGIGVDQNLAESYKWFTLAAQQGDQDAAKKRDDVAGRLDQQSLVAARLAAQTFTPDTPPDEATNVKAPPGGWDRGPTAAPAKPADRRKRQSS
jgi:localization factor PodJL